MNALRACLCLVLGSCTLAFAVGCGVHPDGSDREGEDVGSQSLELHKGTPGAVNGDSNYCDDPAHPCAAGEGDCDSSANCEPGLVCGGLSQYFGLRAGNACAPAHCANRLRDVDETQIDCGGSCGTFCPALTCLPNGAPNRCTSDCLCGPGEGDCDSNDTCQPGLVCGRGKLSQFGLTGDACVPAHCINKIQDADESLIDCGGSCGTVNCPNIGCLEEGAVWGISMSGGFREFYRKLGTDTCTLAHTGTYQRTMQATLTNGALEIQDPGFQGTYPIVQNGASGFKAESGDASSGSGFSCGLAEGGIGSNKFGRVTITVGCTSRVATFSAECYSDLTADGCFPNYQEKAYGSGPQLQCTAGYETVAGRCVDIDECLTSPCALGETCTNLNGSYLCSCDAQSKYCGANCVNVMNDPGNCGDCGAACRGDQTCDNGACACPAGYTEIAGGCVDIDECAAGQDDCSALAVCTNTVGGFSCTCRQGYSGDGKSCADVDECLSSPCAQGQSCTNTEGSYTCACSEPRTQCSTACVDTRTDPLNCGGCGNRCSAGSACVAGTCVAATWSSIDCGAGNTCGIIRGQLLCWGRNDLGQTDAPAGIFLAVSAATVHTCALRSDSSVVCFGSNYYGQATPPSGTFQALGTGNWHSCGLRSDGTLTCWGSNEAGQKLAPSGSFVSLSTGQDYNCALRADGSLACWGTEDTPYIPSPTSGVFTAVSAGGGISCAIRSDGTVTCWGLGMYVGSPPPNSTFSAVSVGWRFACGLRTDGTLACWGENEYGQTNPPAGTFVSVSAGSFHACAIRSDGSAVCWGLNYSQQCNVPTF